MSSLRTRTAAALLAFVCCSLPAAQAQASRYDRYLAPAGHCAGDTDRAASDAVQQNAARCLINWARHKAGVGALTENAALQLAAARKTRALRRCRHFAHEACGKPAFRFVYRLYGGSLVGENLYWGSGRLGSAREALRGWLNSAAHRHIMLDPRFRDQGVDLRRCHFQGNAGVGLWALNVGRR